MDPCDHPPARAPRAEHRLRAVERGRSALEHVGPGGPFAPFLAEQGAVVLDGGLATTLEAMGRQLDAKLWSASLLRDDPNLIRAVHTQFLTAGADCIATVGYQASFEGFAEAGFTDDESVELFDASVELACDARDAFWAIDDNRTGRLRPLVAASVGPYGAYLADGSEYDGRYAVDAAALDHFHRRRFQHLAGTRADVIACETVPSVLEAEVLLRILDETPDAWAWLSFSCQDGEKLNDGTPLAVVARMCEDQPRVAAVGINCTAPEHVTPLLRGIRSETTLPVFVYPNSGEGYDAADKTWSGAVDFDLVSATDAWLTEGAEGVGGCCRVGPEVIAGIRARISVSRGRSDT